jgi:hypothetical protein
MHHITNISTLSILEDHELDLILMALAAISPSGGGSKPYTLLRKIMEDTGRDFPNPEKVYRIQQQVGEELQGE